MLYGLSVGFGQDPSIAAERDFIYQPRLKALPSQATVVAWDDSWLSEVGLDLTKVVHGEQRITLHRPLRPSGELFSSIRILHAFDKGPDRGAVLYVETLLEDASDRMPVARLHSTVFARGDGGFGGPSGSPPALHPAPTRQPDLSTACNTTANQAFLYRLLGDMNPLHVDPDFAVRAGFERPILQGLCTFGVATRAIVAGPCEFEAARLHHVEARFTAPVIPGETLVTDIWFEEDSCIRFQTRVAERSVVVLDRGRAIVSS